MMSDPRRVAIDFLAELAKGSFEPGPYFPDWQDDGPLTLGHDWDNRFLPLFNIDIDNRVVQAVRSRMARCVGISPARLALQEIGADSRRKPPGSQADLLTFGILCDGVPDGTIRLRRGDRRIWGCHAGWRVWELTP
jgi:hypothetical protein